MPKLTEAVVKRLDAPATGERIAWDTELKRFGVRVQRGGKKAFVIKYRNATGKQRKMVLGSWPATTVEQARKTARQHLGDVERGLDPMEAKEQKQSAPNMERLVSEYLDHIKDHKRPNTIKGERSMLDRFVLPNIGNKLVRNVTSQDIEAIVRSLADTPYQANRTLALMSYLFNTAVRWQYRPDNPAKGMRRFHEDARERFLTDDERDRLWVYLDASDDPRARALMLLMVTGARTGEVLQMRWADLDLEAGTWTKPSAHTKQRKLHRVPLSPVALDILKGITSTGENVFGFHEVRPFWRKVCQDLNIQNCRVHDLRHSYASMLVSEGCSLPLIGALLGHTQPKTTSRYAHLSDDALRLATNGIGTKFKRSSD